MRDFLKVLLGEAVETAEDAADVILATITYALIFDEDAEPGHLKSIVLILLLSLIPLGGIRFFINYRMQTQQNEALIDGLNAEEGERVPLRAPRKGPAYETVYVTYPAVSQALMDANALMYILVQKMGTTIPSILLPFLLANGSCHGYVVYGSGEQSLKIVKKKEPSPIKAHQPSMWFKFPMSIPPAFESFVGYPGGIFASVSYLLIFLDAPPSNANLLGGLMGALTLLLGFSSAEYDKVSSMKAFTYWHKGYDYDNAIHGNGWYEKTLEFLFQHGFLSLYSTISKQEKNSASSYYHAKWWANMIARPIMLSGLHFHVINACLQLFAHKPPGYSITLTDKDVAAELRAAALLFTPVMVMLGAVNAAMEADAFNYHWAKKALLFAPPQTEEEEGDTFIEFLRARIDTVETAGRPIAPVALTSSYGVE